MAGSNGLYWLDLSSMSRNVFPAGDYFDAAEGKTKPSRPRQHLNYILRESAREHLATVGIPAEKHAVKRFFEAYDLLQKPDRTADENRRLFEGRPRDRDERGRYTKGEKPLIDALPTGYRKPMRENGRWFYKVMHALPVQMTREQQIEAGRSFCWDLTMHGRGVAVASYHDLGTHNPHVHVVFIDRDIETGRSVALLSEKASVRQKKGLEPNATVYVRKLWEMDCNAVAAKYGLEVRIDQRSNLARGLEAGDQKRGWREQALEEVRRTAPNEQVDELREAMQESDLSEDRDMQADEDLKAEARHTGLSDEEILALGDRPRLVDPSERNTMPLMVERVQRNQRELNDLIKQRTDLAYYQTRYNLAARTAADARSDTTETENIARQWGYKAEDLSVKHAGLFRGGKPRGIAVPEVKVLGFRLGGWKSPLRAEAEQRQQEIRQAESQAESLARAAQEKAEDTRIKEALRDELAEKREILERQLREQGTEQELDDAQRLYEEHIAQDLSEMLLPDLQQAYERGEIDIEAYKEILHLKGEQELVEELEETQSLRM